MLHTVINTTLNACFVNYLVVCVCVCDVVCVYLTEAAVTITQCHTHTHEEVNSTHAIVNLV